MQRVASILPSWDRTKTGTKKGFDKAWGWADKLGAPVNRFSNRIGSEAFWPTTLDKESDKAARILRTFCKDGFYQKEDRPVDGPASNTKQRVLKKIPREVIQNAVGLAIFTTMRTGLWISGAGGSGVLIARQEDGSWSPPSGILLHTAGLGFLVGVDIYDCVVVINNRKALESFTKLRATLGGEISAVAGPVGAGGVLENDGKWKQLNRPVFTYLKSRGLYAGVQVDGTIIIERTDENERFYGEKIGVADILAGKARHPPVHDIKMLMETVKAAEGREDVDRNLMEELDGQPAPGDVNVDSPSRPYEPFFGIPEPDDPDPFGVLALEKAGLEIREAGSRSRPESSQFEYKPSPTSPIYAQFKRMSVDTTASRSNRGSFMSTKTQRTSIDRATQTSEAATQTGTAVTDVSPASSPSFEHSPKSAVIQEEDFSMVNETVDIDYTKIDLGPYGKMHHSNSSQDFNGSGTTANSQSHSSTRDGKAGDDTAASDIDSDDDDDDDDDDEEPVIFEVAAAAQPARPSPISGAMQARAGLVTIAKRIPPALPPRSPMRGSRTLDGAAGSSPLASPSIEKDGFEDVDLDVPRSLSPKPPSLDRSRSPLRETFTVGSETFEDLEKSKSAGGDVHLADLERQETAVALPEMKNTANRGDETDKEKDDEDDHFHSMPPTPNEIANFA